MKEHLLQYKLFIIKWDELLKEMLCFYFSFF